MAEIEIKETDTLQERRKKARAYLDKSFREVQSESITYDEYRSRVMQIESASTVFGWSER